jgi:hypothetical protein
LAQHPSHPNRAPWLREDTPRAATNIEKTRRGWDAIDEMAQQLDFLVNSKQAADC